jgi:transposase InsO family protein
VKTRFLLSQLSQGQRQLQLGRRGNEEVYRNEYRNLQEARAEIGAFLEKVYNQQRLHSALGYRSGPCATITSDA